MAIEIRPSRDAAEFRSALGSIGHYFGGWPDEAAAERFGRLLPRERMHAALDGVTVVGVLPTHRRRGVLRSLMLEQLADVHRRGEPIAALWASEEPIYTRFGYGLASLAGEVALTRTYAGLRDPSPGRGTVRLLSVEEARERLPAVYERVRRETPGMYARAADWWELRQVHDPRDQRGGAGEKVFALLELDGRDAGYAIYRIRMAWEAGSSNGSAEIVEAMADSPEATRELWRFLL